MDSNLLKDLYKYSLKSKANIVYRKCLKNNKTEIAKRIKIKYGLKDVCSDDIVMAYIYSLKRFVKN